MHKLDRAWQFYNSHLVFRGLLCTSDKFMNLSTIAIEVTGFTHRLRGNPKSVALALGMGLPSKPHLSTIWRE